MRKILLLLLFAIFTVGLTHAQKNNGRQVTGKLIDAQTKEALIGASVTIKGTTKATSTSLNGTFKLTVPDEGATLILSYIGYVSKTVEISGPKDLGSIALEPSSSTMNEVVVTAANPSIVIDRKTPIAASSVNQTYIEEKGAGAEFPELLKQTPGVTVSRVGGGYGDSRINIRGFGSNNVALLINGIPANDVEAGRLYWNDWAGLSDVTKLMQVQRGLGASTVAVPSIGGTININTFSTETQQGGTVSQSIGSYNALKTLISYSTGLNDKGWASSFLLSRSTGDGYAKGLYYTGYNYFVNITKVLSKNQTLKLDFMGATQNHGQRYTNTNSVNIYRNAPQGTQYNSDYGYLNGQILSAEQNYYSKPLASLTHNWQINNKSSLSTIAYTTWGSGASRYIAGSNVGLNPTLASGEVPRTGDIYSPIDFNQIVKNNLANANGSSSTYFQDAVNKHQQYGVLSSYKRKIGENIDVLAGLDLRYYEGTHYYEMHDLLGGSFITDTRNSTALTGDVNNPNAIITDGSKFNNYYRYNVASEGAYLQGEYSKNNLTAFVSLAGNNTGNRRLDYFNYLSTDPKRETNWVNFLGYQAKGGVNYNLDAHNNVFANIGYIQRAPLVGTIFLNKENDVNSNAKPEKLLDYELGYGFRSSEFSANVNLYRASYRDRAKTASLAPAQDGSVETYNISGINELHQGVEVDAKYRPVKEITISGQISYADFHYTSNTGAAQITNDDGKTQNVPSLLLKGLNIGDFGANATGAQTTAALGMDIQVLPQIKIGGNWTYSARYYAAYDPSKVIPLNGFSDANPYQPYRLPNFSTFDLNAVYRFKFAGLDASFIANVYNVFNTVYLADAYDSSPLAATQAGGFVSRTNALGAFYGPPRLYMTTLKIKF